MRSRFEELVEAAREAGPIMGRDGAREAGRTYPEEAIAVFRLWLYDHALAGRGVAGIEAAAEAGAVEAAYVALDDAAARLGEGWALTQVSETLGRLSWRGLFVCPQDGWHQVEHTIYDELVVDPWWRLRYLEACRRWNSRYWVTRKGQQILERPARGNVAEHCAVDDFKEPKEWTAARVVGDDGSVQMFLRRNQVWHAAARIDAIVTREGESIVYTRCGWWAEAREVTRTIDMPTTPSLMCVRCGQGTHEAEEGEPSDEDV